MKIYLINGWTDNIGLWEVELFTDKKECKKTFDYYVKEYDVERVDEYPYGACAVLANTEERFYWEEREI